MKGLNYSTKALVAISALAAVAFETILVGRSESGLLPIAVGSVIVGWLAGRRWPERAAGVILAVGTLVPLLWVAATGRFYIWLMPPWVAALVASAAPTFAGSWQYPRPWRFALIAWALAVALTWPLVALRELDWMPSLLWLRPSVYSTAAHGTSTAVFIARVAQVHLLGLLFIDWLFGRFGGTPAVGRPDFERTIVWPSVAAAIVGGAVAAYQGFVRLDFLATSIWPGLGRAGGTLADANASGTLGALWVAIPIGIAFSTPSRGRAWLLTLGALVIALGVWATGSRTALLGAVIALASGLHLTIAGRAVPGRRRAVVLAAAVVVVLAAGILVSRPPATGPLRRVQSLVPDLSASTLRSAAWELWARNGYGLASVAAIRDSPWCGVGVGAFHLLSSGYARLAIGSPLPPDNAQNWFRHQLAEMGILGSVGWAAWVLFFVAGLFRRRAAEGDRARHVTACYAVVGFGIASLLGMPGQSLQIALAFWILAFWVLRLADSNGSTSVAGDGRGLRRSPLLTTLVLAAALVVTTFVVGRGALRPPFRAKEFGHGYRYGLHRPFEGTAGTTRTTAHAVDVPLAPTKWVKLTVWVEHPDANERPVALQVWCDDEPIVRGRFPRGVPMTRYVAINSENRRFVFEARVDRTFQPSASPGPEVGLDLSWEFVNEPPASSRGNPATR